MAPLYALKFTPVCKPKPWGGRKLATYLAKDLDGLSNGGESWEISALGADLPRVANGALAGWTLPALLDRYGAALAGPQVYARHGSAFPLLVKFIDAADRLSLQTHPGDARARQRHGSCGKTEMWYVVQADPGATVVCGFNRPLDVQDFRRRLADGRLAEVLNIEPAAAGDVFFLPAGRVHTLGQGLLVAEIQQASDITYRIHDFGRTGADGKPRSLHPELALAALDFGCQPGYATRYPRQRNRVTTLVACDHFRTNLLPFDHGTTREYDGSSAVIHVCVDGAYRLHHGDAVLEVRRGDSVLIPATLRRVRLSTQTGFTALETFVASADSTFSHAGALV